MEPKLQKYYEDRWTLFSTQGWKDLMEDVQKIYDNTNNIHTAKSFEEFNFRKGELSILHWLITLQEVSERTFEEINNEDTV